MLNLKNKKIIVLAHIMTTIPGEDLKKYLLDKKINQLMFIGHPLFYKAGRPGPHYYFYQENNLIKKVQFKNRHYPALIQYLKDFLLTIYWIIKMRKRWDWMIALDNLNALAGLFLKKIGLVKKVIYYTIDFTPQRFNNKLLNNFYHYLDKVCVKNCDLTWNISPRIAVGRENIRGLKREKYNRQVDVPIGVWLKKDSLKEFSEIKAHTLVYAGGLSEHQGVQLVLEAIPLIIEKIPDFKFIIIGMGSYEKNLKEQVKQLKIERNVYFTGYLEKHEEVEEMLSICGLAVAMYNKDLARWSYYADPSKIKSYLNAGLPVITTSLTYIADELVNKKCGVVVDYQKESLADAIVSIFQNSTRHQEMRVNAFKFIQDYSWQVIFNRGLEKL